MGGNSAAKRPAARLATMMMAKTTDVPRITPPLPHQSIAGNIAKAPAARGKPLAECQALRGHQTNGRTEPINHIASDVMTGPRDITLLKRYPPNCSHDRKAGDDFPPLRGRPA